MKLLALALLTLTALTPVPSHAGPLGLKGHAATGGGSIPITFGDKTPSGYGCVDLTVLLPTFGTITITALTNGLGNPSTDFTITSPNLLCPSGTFAAKKFYTGPYAGTLSDGTLSQDIAIPILPNTAFIRAKVTDANNSSELDDLLNFGAADNRSLKLGDTVYGRDGWWNPSSAGWRIRPPAGGYGAGTGSTITIRSETVDTAMDSNGNPRLQHGFKIGGIQMDAAVVGPGPMPFTFRDIWFFSNVPVPTLSSAALLSATSTGYGISAYNSRFEIGPLNTGAPNPTRVNYVGFLSGNTANGTPNLTVADHNHFIGLGKSLSGNHATFTWNVIEDGYEDAMANSDGPNYIEYNFAFNFHKVAGTHADASQNGGTLSAGTDYGRSNYNIFVRNVSTGDPNDLSGGVFNDDTNSPSYFVNAEVKNNIMAFLGANMVFMHTFNNPIIRFNTLLANQPNANSTTGNIQVHNGTDAVVERNITNATPSTASQFGTVTLLFNTAISASSFPAYQAAFPALVNPMVDMNNRAQALAKFTPNPTGVSLNGDGSFSGALFPACPGQANGAWNDGTVWNCANPTWLADHPPAQ
jgi:hypothetical protein